MLTAVSCNNSQQPVSKPDEPSGLLAEYNMLAEPTDLLADLSELNKNTPVIMRSEPPVSMNRGELEVFPQTIDLQNPFSIDLRSYDISKLDLGSYGEQLKYVSFDNDTKWPDNLPEGFDPARIMELGKNPGLGIRKLHEMGITGKGVNIAIIDSALLLDHEEYKDNIMLYELMHCQDASAQMHGAMVTSIAVGKTVGVAPDAKVYYIASTFGTVTETAAEMDLGYIAKAIMRILEINNNLTASEQIRVISISSGFRGGEKGAEEITEAIEAAKRAGVFVITSAPNTDYNFYMTGIGRDLYDDPDDVNSYSPGLLWTNSIDMYRDISRENNLLLVPMDSRTYASFTGNSNYAYNREGGNSLTNPWLAGLYALCIQVKPEITSEEFIETAFETGDTMIYQHDGGSYELGIIVNPVKMVERLSER